MEKWFGITDKPYISEITKTLGKVDVMLTGTLEGWEKWMLMSEKERQELDKKYEEQKKRVVSYEQNITELYDY